MKKKLMAVLLAALMLLTTAACTATPEAVSESDTKTPVSQTELADSVTVHAAALKGPTGVSIAQLAKKGSYDVTFAGSPDEVVSKIITGELDIACVPTNLASVLYAKTKGEVKVCAVTTLGVLYLLDTSGEVKSINDLAGRTIGATGQGSNPEYIINYILSGNGLSDTKVEYSAEHAEIAAKMIAGDVKTAIMPEPFVTQVCAKLGDAVNVIDLQSEWARLADGVQLAQGVLVVRSEFADEHPEALASFLKDFEESSSFAANNVKETAGYCAELGIIASAEIAEKAITRCNIVYIDAGEMKESVSGFLNVLYNANPKSVGGALPDDAFYYGA